MHSRTLIVVLFCVSLNIPVVAQGTPPADKGLVERPAEPRQLEVKVPLTIMDSGGNPLRSVTKEQVTVLDTNQPAKVLQLQSASDLPLDLGIVLLATREKFDQQQMAAIELVKKALRPGTDRAFVITAGGKKGWQGARLMWQTDPAEIEQTIRGLDSDAGFPDAFDYRVEVASSGSDRHAIEYYTGGGGVTVFDVCWKMMASDPRPVRRAVVMFRKASQHSPGMQDRVHKEVENNHARVIAISQAVGMVIYTLGVDEPNPRDNTMKSEISTSYVAIHPGDTTNTRQYDRELNRNLELQFTGGRHNVERLSDDTGGLSVWAKRKDYSDATAVVASALLAPYFVTFAPASGVTNAQVHPMRIQVANAGKVAAPHAFVMPARE